MTDSFSLPNAAELVELIKNEEYFWREDDYTLHNPHVKIVKAAASTIEALLSENEKLKAERDAAVTDIKKNWLCYSCKKRVVGKEWIRCESLEMFYDRDHCCTCKSYEWRGVKEKEDD